MTRAARLFALFLLARSVAAQSVTARPGGELSGFLHGQVLVPIVVDMTASGGQSLGSYTAVMRWDPVRLTASCYYNGCYTIAGNFPAPHVNSDSSSYGVLRFTAVSPVGVGGVVTLTQIPFTINDTVPSPVTLSFSEMSAAGAPFTNLLPILTVTSPMNVCPARGRWGDIDRDGRSNSRDALLMLSKVVGLPVDTIIDTVASRVDTTLYDSGLGDVDADGRVTSRDALITLSYAVGISIPGQRVMLLASPSACATGSARTLVLSPSQPQLAVGQSFQLLLQARDTAGRLVAVDSAGWRTSNGAVAGVDQNGFVSPRAAGTVIITAELGPGVQAADTISVIARRANWYVDAHKTGAPFQLGTQALPYEHPSMAFAVAQEGDTIRVASGNYDFTESGTLNVGVVIIGGTLGDTTTRPVFRDASGGGGDGLSLQGGVRTVVRNVAFKSFGYPIDLEGVRSFALEDSRIDAPSYYSAYGIYQCGPSMDSVRVANSALLGDSVSRGGTGMMYDYCSVVGVTRLRNATIRYWGDGLDLADADSTDIAGSVISDNDGYGIELEAEYETQPALHVSHSRIENNSYEAVYSGYARRVVLDTTVVTSAYYEAIDLGGYYGLANVYLRGDTFNLGRATSWISANGEGAALDTLLVDGSRMQWPSDSVATSYSQASINFGSITRTRFVNVGSGTTASIRARAFFADSVEMTACPLPGCDTGDGFDVNASGTTLDLHIDRSRFTSVGYAIYAYGGGIQRVTRTRVDSAISGISLEADSIVVTDDSLARITSDGMTLYQYSAGPKRVYVARDTVLCSPGSGAYGIEVYDHPYTVENNVVASCYYAIYGNGLVGGSVFRANTIRTSFFGMRLSAQDTIGSMIVDSNGISGSDSAAVRLVRGALTMVGNNVVGNARYGLWVQSINGPTSLHQVHGNSFTSNGLYALYSPSDSVNAQQNWWGQPAGPCTPGADCVAGRVDATLFLPSPPSGLPPLAPPVFMSSLAAPIGPLAVKSVATSTVFRPWQRTVTVRDVTLIHASPARAALVQQSNTRRAARAVRDADRVQAAVAARARLQAAAATRHAAKTRP